ncbi:hypothetical protein M0813_29739 [Anaeramoeba flamelloides]|uniref:Uncharacterized protein n=1 Tax=Anaeramoeba flamelloides TaxID=1746091 RepID=A0ABQ8XMZ2_9EUKA|nr:hypothetical protein M0813_29739 [Anaeramoeba flamelloides]
MAYPFNLDEIFENFQRFDSSEFNEFTNNLQVNENENGNGNGNGNGDSNNLNQFSFENSLTNNPNSKRTLSNPSNDNSGLNDNKQLLSEIGIPFEDPDLNLNLILDLNENEMEIGNSNQQSKEPSEQPKQRLQPLGVGSEKEKEKLPNSISPLNEQQNNQKEIKQEKETIQEQDQKLKKEPEFVYRRPRTRSQNNTHKNFETNLSQDFNKKLNLSDKPKTETEIKTEKIESKYGMNVSSVYRKRNLKKTTRKLSDRNSFGTHTRRINPYSKLSHNNNLANSQNSNNSKNKKQNEKLDLAIRENSSIVESGKEVYKLLTGVLWVMTGGASIKLLTPFSETISSKIGEVLSASKNEQQSFKHQLKYLLTNSRRTFTEYILEIVIAILSLRFLPEEEEEISVKFWDILTEIVEIQSSNNSQSQTQTQPQQQQQQQQTQQQQSQKESQSNQNQPNQNSSLNKEKISKRKEELHQELQIIYKDIFTERILMFWFGKRFIDRLEAFFGTELKAEFYEQHFCFFGKSKFMLSCLILANELVNQEGVTKEYADLVDLEYNGDIINLYLNNRGKKQGLIKELIVKYQLNSGHYWQILSKEYLSELKFDHLNLFNYFPFKEIIANPLLIKLCGTNINQQASSSSSKKRVLSTKTNVIDNMLNIGWIMKKEEL